MHALQHAYASVLLDAGESIKALSEYLGHSDPGFTLRTYTHLLPSSGRRTRKAIDDAFTEPREFELRSAAAGAIEGLSCEPRSETAGGLSLITCIRPRTSASRPPTDVERCLWMSMRRTTMASTELKPRGVSVGSSTVGA